MVILPLVFRHACIKKFNHFHFNFYHLRNFQSFRISPIFQILCFPHVPKNFVTILARQHFPKPVEIVKIHLHHNILHNVVL